MFGEVMFQLQSLERILGIVLAMVVGPGPTKITREECRVLLDSYFGKTFGQLGRLEQVAELPPSVMSRLRDAIDKRNWLAHHYFWDRAKAICDSHGRAAMLEELLSAGLFFKALADDLADVYKAWLSANGVALEDLPEP